MRYWNVESCDCHTVVGLYSLGERWFRVWNLSRNYLLYYTFVLDFTLESNSDRYLGIIDSKSEKQGKWNWNLVTMQFVNVRNCGEYLSSIPVDNRFVRCFHFGFSKFQSRSDDSWGNVGAMAHNFRDWVLIPQFDQSFHRYFLKLKQSSTDLLKEIAKR